MTWHLCENLLATAIYGSGLSRQVIFVLILTKQGGLWLGMTGGLSKQVKMNVKPIGAFKSGLIRQVVFERRGLKIQGPLYMQETHYQGVLSTSGEIQRDWPSDFLVS